MIIENRLTNKGSIIKRIGLWGLVFFFILLLFIGTILYYLSANYPQLFFTEEDAKKFFHNNYFKTQIRYFQSGKPNWRRLLRESAIGTFTSHTLKYLNNEKLPHINININFTSWNEIKNERRSMKGKIFMAVKKKYHKASIQYNGKNIPVKIRLKGGRTDHISHQNKWSFRIKTRKETSIFGLKSFSIQAPFTRGYQREAVFHGLGKHLGILALRFFFVDVSINGENIGMMALEEHFSKELLESNGYKEGVIFKFNEENVPKIYHAVLESRKLEDPQYRPPNQIVPIFQGHYERLYRLYYNSLNSFIESFSDKPNSLILQNQKSIAIGLFKGVLEGKLLPSKVFDAKKMGFYFAYLSLWGNSHSARFRNIRYYFNPYSYKFEPILFDSNANSLAEFYLYPNDQTITDHEFNRILLSDKKIMQTYLDSVDKLYNKSRQPNFIQTLDKIESKPLSNLRQEYLFAPQMNLTSLKQGIKKIKKQIESGEFFKEKLEKINTKEDPIPLIIPKNLTLPEVIKVNLVRNKNETYLEIHNLFPLEAYITKLSIKIDNKPFEISTTILDELPITIPPFYYNSFVKNTFIKLHNIPINSKIEISGKVKIKTQLDKEYDFVVGQSYPSLNTHPLRSNTNTTITKTYPFITYLPEKNLFYIRPGVWKIKKKIIFPEGASLKISENTKLLFKKNAGFIVKGPVSIIGSKTNPIVFDSIDGTLNNAWSGFTVMNANQESTVSDVLFKNVGFAKHNTWELTGAVTFYKSDVVIKNVKFINSTAEDALNIVQSKFIMKNTEISGTKSDGFDGDFVTGEISKSRFDHIGGDAIDFSGSNIKVSETKFHHVHDKAVSIGEASTLSASKIHVAHSGTGFVVKDGSQGKIKHSIFENMEHSVLMSYNKKNVYGSATLNAENIDFMDKQYSIISQKGNKLLLDGRLIPPIKINIEKLYSEGYMKK